MKTGTKIAIGAGAVGLVGAWYAIWGQWGMIAPHRTYKGIRYMVSNMTFGTGDTGYWFRIEEEATRRPPPEWTAAGFPANGEHYATGPDADAQVKLLVDAYRAGATAQLSS